MLFEHPEHVVRTPKACCSRTQKMLFEHPERDASEDGSAESGAPNEVGRITLGNAGSFSRLSGVRVRLRCS